jgi:hypothetical protein
MEETQKQEQSAATIVAEKSASIEDNEFFDANQATDDHDDDDDGKLVSKDTMETQDSDNGDTDVAASKSLSKKTRGKNKKKNAQREAQSGLSNKLTKLLPGYVAPMKLAAPSLDRYRALPPLARGGGGRGEDAASPASLVAGLDALRRKAVQQEFQTTTSSTRTNSVKYSMQHHAQVMLQKTTASSSSSASSYVNTHASFKRGSKRPPVNHAGEGWFGMQATPMTAELERDLLLIRNRNYLDPKRFYKSADNKKKPSKFVQAGTVIEGAAEFYSSRLVKRQRRGNLVEEIMAESSALSNRKPNNNSSSSGLSGGAGTSGSSADYVMKKYKTMQTERTTKAQAWHKRNDSKGRRKPQRK